MENNKIQKENRIAVFHIQHWCELLNKWVRRSIFKGFNIIYKNQIWFDVNEANSIILIEIIKTLLTQQPINHVIIVINVYETIYSTIADHTL